MIISRRLLLQSHAHNRAAGRFFASWSSDTSGNPSHESPNKGGLRSQSSTTDAPARSYTTAPQTSSSTSQNYNFPIPPRFSTVTYDYEEDDDDDYDLRPYGDLFDAHRHISASLVGTSAQVRRVFGAGANAQGLLACGGEALARHASFDPNYNRARSYIQNRAIGPAVLSPVLIGGMVGALVEAALPQSIPIRSELQQVNPLIVGVEVAAKATVVQVQHFTASSSASETPIGFTSRQDGYEIELETQVTRTQDGAIIAQGSHSVWVPSSIAS